MSQNSFAKIYLSAVLLMATTSACFSAQTLPAYRAQFLQAEAAVQLNQEAKFAELSQGLTDYVLYPYLQYQWLTKHLQYSDKIQAFLGQFTDSRYAPLLRNQWLRYLAQNQQWSEFLKQYQTSSSRSMQCLYRYAQYQATQKKLALTEARKLWSKGKSQPKTCDPLFKHLLESKYFTRQLRWKRFHRALDNNKVRLARYVQGLMDKPEQATADLWLQVHLKPSTVIEANANKLDKSQSGLLFAHAIKRLSRIDLDTATAYWDKYRKKYQLSSPVSAQVERRLALALAYRRDERASARLNQLSQSDSVVRQWRVRSALMNQNWKRVENAVTNLSEPEKAKINWQYWLARSLDKNGKPEQAREHYRRIAADRSFYGFLSATKLNQPLVFNDQPLKISQANVQKLASTNDFLAVSELRELDRELEAKSQWWHALAKLDKPGILTAAKLAQLWHWDAVAIITIAKAQYWDDVNLRFPLKYTDLVTKNAQLQALDPAIVYGIIRRESAFNEQAVSSAGARGLMQIMPRTGLSIARKLKEKWQNAQSLFSPTINVKYGTFYYKQLLERFNGHYALATAAYNAGPHRVTHWLPKENPVATDIWVETIPFNETRSYVAAVLSYALIYQNRMNRNDLKIEDFIPDISPIQKQG